MAVVENDWQSDSTSSSCSVCNTVVSLYTLCSITLYMCFRHLPPYTHILHACIQYALQPTQLAKSDLPRNSAVLIKIEQTLTPTPGSSLIGMVITAHLDLQKVTYRQVFGYYRSGIFGPGRRVPNTHSSCGCCCCCWCCYQFSKNP